MSVSFTVHGTPAPQGCGTTTGYRNGCRCRGCQKAHAIYATEHRKTPAGRRAAWRHDLRKTSGLSIEQYESMLTTQDGRCAICKEPCATGRNLAVDHDHETGRIRALLCQGCNLGIGHFRESPELLQAAARYLK